LPANRCLKAASWTGEPDPGNLAFDGTARPELGLQPTASWQEDPTGSEPPVNLRLFNVNTVFFYGQWKEEIFRKTNSGYLTRNNTTENAVIIYSRLIADNNLPKIAFLAESFNLV
jgi:hypothetical protein